MKKSMKSCVVLLMVLVMGLTLIGCSKSKSEETKTSKTESTKKTETTEKEETSTAGDEKQTESQTTDSKGEISIEEIKDVKSDEQRDITLIVKNLTNPMWIAVKEGAEEAASDAGVNLTVLAPSVADNNEEQISLIEQSIAKGEDALIIIPADSTGIVPGIEAANKAGIPVINVNTKIDTSSGCSYNTFIAVENYSAAVSVAEALVVMMEEKGDVIILEGKAGAQSSVDIVAGANDTFAKYDGINVVASQTASWSRSEAYTVTLNLLEANPDVKAIFAANDEMAMGALEAVAQAGKEGQILITGLDANPDAKEAVDAGTLAITCDKNGHGQGYYGVKAAIAALNGEKLLDNYIVETFLYTK